MDERIWALALVFLLVTVVGIFDAIQYRVGKALGGLIESDEKGWAIGCLAALISVPVGLVFVAIAAWADLILWNMVAPKLGLPELDYLTVFALGWLIGLLFRGISPMRVRVHGTVTD